MSKYSHPFVFLILIFIIEYSDSQSTLPSSITPCKQLDPDFNQCFLRECRRFLPEFLKGNSEFDIPNMDPFIIGSTEFSTDSGFTMKSDNGILTGLIDGVFDDISIDFRKKKLSIVFESDLESRNDYTVSGKVLNFPINGKGAMDIKLFKFKAKLSFSYTLVKDKNENEYLKLKLLKKEIVLGKVMFKLNGLFSHEFDETMNRLLNDNWKDVMAEVGSPGIDVVIVKMVDIINKFLLKVPFNVLFP